MHPPVIATRFVGREDLLARLGRSAAEHRVVTVLGPPGIGKTSLVDRWIESRRDSPVWRCDLRAVLDEASLLHVLASTVSGGEMASLAAAMDAREGAVVVLDNFEQLVASSARLLSDLCRATRNVAFVLTSRERLGLAEEFVLEVPPLECPPQGVERDLASYPAVGLFVERAARMGVERIDLVGVASLVRRLQGIPLAIELAAAQSRTLAPSVLEARIAERGDRELLRLRHPLVGQDPRHVTLEAAIVGSYEALDEAERIAFAECSVFVGGFAPACLERVLTAGEDALRIVQSLRDKSLLHTPVEGRLAMYESVRAFAAKRQLDDAVRCRHASWLAERARLFVVEHSMAGNRLRIALREELIEERDNLRAALGFLRARRPRTAEQDREFAALAIAHAQIHGDPTEACFALVDESCSHAFPNATGDLPLLVQALLCRQGLANTMGLYERCRADLDRLLALEVDDETRTMVLVYRGIQLRYQGLWAEAWDCHQRAEALIRGSFAGRLVAMNVVCMGRLEADRGHHEAARRLDESARMAALARGDELLEGVALANLGQLAQEEGSFEQAEGLLQRAIAKFSRTHEAHYEAIYTAALGDLYFEWGRLDDARAAHASAAAFFEHWLAHRQTVLLCATSAALEASAGELELASAHLGRALHVARRSSSPLIDLAVELHGAHLELATSRPGSGVAEKWMARLHELRADESPGARPYATSFDVRFAARMLARALATPCREATPSTAPSGARAIARDGSAFATKAGVPVDLSRRPSLRRMLAALVLARTVEPGGVRSAEALLAAGWPGERVIHEAAATRVRVAIATLRSLGLRDLLLTREGGYLLDPRVEVTDL